VLFCSLGITLLASVSGLVQPKFAQEILSRLGHRRERHLNRQQVA
jgi:hypothetical protein